MNVVLSKYLMYLLLSHFSPSILSVENFIDKYTNEYVVHCPGGYSEAKNVAIQMGFVLHHKMMGFDNHFVFKHKINSNEKSNFHSNRLKRSAKVNWVEQQILLKRVKRDMFIPQTSINFIDPLFRLQWYLIRSENDKTKIDMNVIEAWKLGYTGKGVVISILDDGIDYRHDDLKDNYDPSASYDINGNDNDPLPNLKFQENRHGTRCAGEVSAKANNSKCGVGIAYNSNIGAVRMLDGDVTDRVEAEALSFKQQHIDIYSGSWGPDDSGQRVEGPAVLAKSAFEKGTKYGRNGLGNIYVWASGNGGKKKDSCACDGYASSIYTVSISSVSEFNRKPWYLESCASTLASTYSSGNANEKKIISTDLNNQCAIDHTGTSASAPLAAGIIALLLEANRNLTWRDVQYIIVMTSNSKPFLNGEFIFNGANRKVSNWYGFGLMDTGKMVRLGRLWISLPPQHVCKTSKNDNKIHLKGKFKVNASTSTISCSGNEKVNYVEHVILYLKLEYQRRGDLQIHLISPTGTRSKILPYRPYDFTSGSTAFDIWPLMSVQFWGEQASGVWAVEIDNYNSPSTSFKGYWSSFDLEIYGTDKWPTRLKSADFNTNDKWFQQFERLVVDDTNDNVQIKSKSSSRSHADTNNIEYIIGNIECDDECFNKTCSAAGAHNCDSCKNYQTSDGECVSKCPLGSYLDSHSRICEICHFSCDECSGPGIFNCSRCHVGDLYIVKTKQCEMSIKDCPKGYFKDLKTCKKCPENCAVCTSNFVCSECRNSFVLTLQSQCRSSCDIGSYSDNRNRCRVCHMSCLSCLDGDSFSCTSCNHGSFINFFNNHNSHGQCVKKCPFGYFTNHTISSCYRCHQNCKTCSGPSSEMCTDCIPPMELSKTGHTCIDPVSYNCKPDEFKSSIGKCEKCPPMCQTCSDDRCTSCSINKHLFNKSCVTKCPTGYFLLSSSNTCLSCHEYCNSCNNNTMGECSHCSQKGDFCGHHCNKLQYWDINTNTCRPCHSTCEACFGDKSENCTSCIPQKHYLSSGKCLEKCPQGEYLFNFQNEVRCVACHQSCQNSMCDSGNGRCFNCSHGHNLSTFGMCERIITCPISEFWNKNQMKCVKCDDSCRSCSQKGLCTSCPRNFCLDSQWSTCRPCCSPFSLNKNCSPCLFGRELCLSENNNFISPVSLLIFRHPIGMSLLMAFFLILLFLLIMFYFYCSDIVYYFNKGHGGNSKQFVKYKKLQNLNNLSDNNDEIFSSDEDILPNDIVQFRNTTISLSKSVLLETVDQKNNVQINGITSVENTQLHYNIANGNTKIRN